MEAAVTAPVLSPASAAARLASPGLSAAQWDVLEATGGQTVKQSANVVTEVRRQPRQCHDSVMPAADWPQTLTRLTNDVTGMCEHVTGACECGPDYLGSDCSERCTRGSWGRDCHAECDCVTGEECHHVTGECAPCSQGRYGDMCREQCECDEAGTELCSHKVRLLR